MRKVTLALAVVSSLLLLAAPFAAADEGALQPACPSSTEVDALAVQPEASYVFEGCWTYWASGPCRDIFRDGSGGYWECKLCGTTSNPGPGQCSRISIQTLNLGYWCS